MLNLHKRWLTGIITGLIMPVISTYAADESEPYAPGRWSWTATAGLMIWSDLKDLEPAAGGGFDSLGTAVELGGHKHVAHWGPADILIGVDFGISATQSDIPGITENFTETGVYLTPSMKFRFGERSRRYLNLEAGLGWYLVDIAEYDCEDNNFDSNNIHNDSSDDDNFNNIVCTLIARPYDEDTLGGYLGITGGFGAG